MGVKTPQQFSRAFTGFANRLVHLTISIELKLACQNVAEAPSLNPIRKVPHSVALRSSGPDVQKQRSMCRVRGGIFLGFAVL
jgi:hypothetical protein